MADTEHMFLSDMRRGAIVAFGSSFPTILASPFSVLHPEFVAATKDVRFIFLALVSADVYCSTLFPPYAVPPLESCDAALRALEQAGARCGRGEIIFGPTSSGPGTVRLPAMYIGSEPQVPVSEAVCVISVLWQPKPGVRPPIAEFDMFTFSNILSAAYSIRNRCMKRSEQYHITLGRAWIQPHQWIDIQFGSVLGPRGLAINASDVRSGGLTVRMADGSNQTVASSMLGQMGDCGAATGANISEMS